MKISVFYFLPKKWLSGLAGRLAELKCSFFVQTAIRWYSRFFQITLTETQITDPKAFACFNDFFIRQLRPEARPIADASLVSPCDGALGQWGNISSGTLLQAKGQSYKVTALLGGDQSMADVFISGSYLTAYLSPKDYHRVHMPTQGQLQTMTLIKGTLFPVFTSAIEKIPDLFARNERVVSIFQTQWGKMALVLVGALNVGSMTTAWHDGEVVSSEPMEQWSYHDQAIELSKGQEMGYFKLGGSTVVLLFEKSIDWPASLVVGQPVQMGQAMIHC